MGNAVSTKALEQTRSKEGRVFLPHTTNVRDEACRRRAQALIRANHELYSVYLNDPETIGDNRLRPNTFPLTMFALFTLDVDPNLLNVFNDRSSHLRRYLKHDGMATEEITQGDWREYAGKPIYAQAFTTYFDDELMRVGYDGRQLLQDYVERNGVDLTVFGMLPLQFLGCAFALDIKELIEDALAMGAASSPLCKSKPLEQKEEKHHNDAFNSLASDIEENFNRVALLPAVAARSAATLHSLAVLDALHTLTLHRALSTSLLDLYRQESMAGVLEDGNPDIPQLEAKTSQEAERLSANSTWDVIVHWLSIMDVDSKNDEVRAIGALRHMGLKLKDDDKYLGIATHILKNL